MPVRPKYETRSRRNSTTKKESKAAYERVATRSGGVCEGCGIKPAQSKHHRLYRSRGGLDTADNLLDLCGRSNVDGCHGRAHTAEGEVLGWSVRSRFDPATIPVEHFLLGRVYLCEDGTTTAEPISSDMPRGGAEL